MRRGLALRHKRAVQRAYRRHAAGVYRYALAVLADPDDAEDIVHRTFLKAYLRRRRGNLTRLHLNDLLAIAHDVCRRRAGSGAPLEPAYSEARLGFGCERAEFAISRGLDDRLSRHELRFLSVHLSVCDDCREFARSLRRQRDALRVLAAIPVPETLATGPRSAWWRFDPVPDRKFSPARASP